MTAPAQAMEMEVLPRTIQRDIDASTEASLPVITIAAHWAGSSLGSTTGPG